MKETYEKPDVVSEEIFERTALSCMGGFSTSVSPSGATTTSFVQVKTECSSCCAYKS
jgi:hypothetical protein